VKLSFGNSSIYLLGIVLLSFHEAIDKKPSQRTAVKYMTTLSLSRVGSSS
jgi:hypothetical protein